MNKFKLEPRKLTGKKAKNLRNQGQVPAVIYNRKTESTAVKGDAGDFIRMLQDATTTTIFDLELDGKTIKALIKEVDVDPVRDEIRHVAFYEIDGKEPMVFEIPVTLEGVAPAVKNNVGVLIQPNNSIEVRCVLANLVSEIIIDISGLKTPGDVITVKDLELPEGMSLLHKDDLDTALVSITEMQTLLSEETPDEEEEIEEGAEEAEEGEEGTDETEEGSEDQE